MAKKKSKVDLKLHMAVKSLAILQGEINCKIDELVKKVNLFKEKEEDREKTDFLLGMIIDNMGELQELLEQRNNLRKQIEKLEETETDLMKEEKVGFTL